MNCEGPSIASDAELPTKEEKRIHKRRSSIFQSRVNGFEEYEGAKKPRVEERESEKERRRDSEPVEEETFDLAAYVESLRVERKRWIETWRRRKSERKNLTAKKLSLQDRGQPLDLNVLSDSERAFVRARPNYERVCENRKQLLDVAMKVSALEQLTRKLNQKFISQMEEKLYDVTKRIIKISES